MALAITFSSQRVLRVRLPVPVALNLVSPQPRPRDAGDV